MSKRIRFNIVAACVLLLISSTLFVVFGGDLPPEQKVLMGASLTAGAMILSIVQLRRAAKQSDS